MSGPGWLYLCCLSFSITYTVLWFPSETDRSIRRRFDGSSVTPSVTGEGCRDGLETVNLLWLQSWCQAPLETWNLALLLGPHTLPRGWRGVPLGREHDLGVKWVFSWGQFLEQLGGWMLSHEGTWAGTSEEWHWFGNSVVPSNSLWKMSDWNHWGSGSWGGCWVIAAVIIIISVMFKIVNKVEGGGWVITWVCLFCSFTGEGNGTPLQHSCLENPVDGGAW